MELKSDKTLNKVLIIGVFIVQALGALFLLAPAELLSAEPIYTGDYPAFFYRCVAMLKMLSTSGTPGGYDPYLKAGYFFSSSMGDGSRAMQLLARLFPPAGAVFVVKWYVMAVLLIIPLLLYLAARNLDLSERETAILLTSGLVLWWIPLYPYYLMVFGLINFVLASYLSLYIATLLYKLTTAGGARPVLLLSVLVPLVVLIHMGSLVLLVPLLVVCAGVLRRTKRVYLLLLFLVLAFVLNGFWLVPYLRDLLPNVFRAAFTTAEPVIEDSAWTKHLTEVNLLKHLKTFFTGITFPLAVFAAVGFYKLRERGGEIKFYMFLVASIFFAALNYFGSSLPGIVLLQPIRFKLPMLLFLLIPMSVGISYLYEKVTQRYKNLKLMPAILCLLCITTLYAIPAYRSRDDLNAKLSVGGKRLLEWIRANTDKKARVLLEGDDLALRLGGTIYYGGHLPILLPHLTNREFISTTFPNLEFPGFSNGVLFTQDIGSYSLKDLQKYFELYNIRWIICWSEPAVDALMARPEYIPFVNKIDRFYIFEAHRKPSYFYKGSGDVEADYNTFRLTNIKSAEGSIVIKYHWVEGLRTVPERVIQPVYLDLDPYGFIEILDPPESITVHYVR